MLDAIADRLYAVVVGWGFSGVWTMNRTNVCLCNSFNERVEFFVDPANPEPRMSRIRAELAEYQSSEPDSGWKLQTRGDSVGWHAFRD
jgi:hypothetical protein